MQPSSPWLRRREAKCPPIDDWLKMWYAYTMEYYSFVRKSEILSFVTTWMDLEHTMLSEVRQPTRDHDFTHVGHNTETHGHKQ